MAEVLDPTSMMESAREAAAAGDFHAAERLLRDAAALQEAALGADHPDLATTLNNLAFVCERTSNIAEAERGYRRAHAIAVASLPPGHPLVATSVRNLVDFCGAYDIPIWKPPATAPAVETSPAVETPSASHVPAPEREPASPPAWTAPRSIAVAAIALAAAIVSIVLLTGRSPEDAEPAAASPVSTATPPVTSSPRAEETAAAEPTSDATLVRAEESGEPHVASAASPVTVLTARLCTTLERSGSPDWECAAAGGDLPAGTYIFYTRVRTNANTTVEHRWYREDRVYQVTHLRVAASSDRGYRTFSRTTISPERAGNWKVELRTADGTLLEEERFVIR